MLPGKQLCKGCVLRAAAAVPSYARVLTIRVCTRQSSSINSSHSLFPVAHLLYMRVFSSHVTGVQSVCCSHWTVLSTGRRPARPVSVPILPPREMQALGSQKHDTEILQHYAGCRRVERTWHTTDTPSGAYLWQYRFSTRNSRQEIGQEAPSTQNRYSYIYTSEYGMKTGWNFQV